MAKILANEAFTVSSFDQLIDFKMIDICVMASSTWRKRFFCYYQIKSRYSNLKSIKHEGPLFELYIRLSHDRRKIVDNELHQAISELKVDYDIDDLRDLINAKLNANADEFLDGHIELNT